MTVSDYNGTSITYSYDGMGNRIGETVEKENQNSITMNYVNNVNLQYPEVISMEKNHQVYNFSYGVERLAMNDEYYYHDGLGSVSQLIGSSGEIIAEYSYTVDGVRDIEYDPYIMDNMYGYRGEAHTMDGLQYLRARYYDPQLARFLMWDEYEGKKRRPRSKNRYAYGENNPNRYRDPSGRSAYNEKTVNGVKKLYYNSTLVTGMHNGIYYENGLKKNGVSRYDGKLYENGIVVHGVRWNANGESVYYENGKPYTGTRNGYIYKDGVRVGLVKDGKEIIIDEYTYGYPDPSPGPAPGTNPSTNTNTNQNGNTKEIIVEIKSNIFSSSNSLISNLISINSIIAYGNYLAGKIIDYLNIFKDSSDNKENDNKALNNSGKDSPLYIWDNSTGEYFNGKKLFNSVDEAAFYFAQTEVILTIQDNSERGSYIRKVNINGKIKYFIEGYINPGGHNDVVVEAISGILPNDHYVDYNSISYSGYTDQYTFETVHTPIVAFVHTHPHCECHRGNVFSPQDKFVSDVIDIFYGDENIKMYLVAANGNLFGIRYEKGFRVLENLGPY